MFGDVLIGAWILDTHIVSLCKCVLIYIESYYRYDSTLNSFEKLSYLIINVIIQEWVSENGQNVKTSSIVEWSSSLNRLARRSKKVAFHTNEYISSIYFFLLMTS